MPIMGKGDKSENKRLFKDFTIMYKLTVTIKSILFDNTICN